MHGKSWTHTIAIMAPVNLSGSLVITESQNHRMVEVGRNVGRSSGLTVLQQACPKLVAQDHRQMDFEYLHRWTHHNLPWQLVPVLSHPHREKSVAWCSDWTFCVSLYVHCICHWVLLRDAWLFFASFLQVFTSIDKIPTEPSFLQVQHSQLSQSFVIETCPSPFIISVVLCWTLFSVAISFQNWPQHSRCGSLPVLSRREGSALVKGSACQ